MIESKRKAVESLIQDKDPQTRRLLLEELSATCFENRRLLKKLVTSRCPEIQSFAQEAIERARYSISDRLPLQHLECDGIPEKMGWEQLESFSWWLAKQNDPHFKPKLGSDQLDQWAELLDRVSMDCKTPEGRIRKLQKVLAYDVGLKGDSWDYYSPENSYLNYVIDRKKGIPLSLTLIYIFVGRRVGWNVTGLNMPGHYLASIDDVVFDPFFSGKILSCKELKERYFLPECEFHDLEAFQVDPKETAQRILANLYSSYLRSGDCQRLGKIEGYLQMISESS